MQFCASLFERKTARRPEGTPSIAENPQGHLLAVIPALASGLYNVEIVTQYSGGGKLAPYPKTTTFVKPLTVA